MLRKWIIDLSNIAKYHHNIIKELCHSRYEVKFQQAMECGGAYVKLLSNHDALHLVSLVNLQVLFQEWS